MPTTIVMEKNVLSDRDEDEDEDRDRDRRGKIIRRPRRRWSLFDGEKHNNR